MDDQTLAQFASPANRHKAFASSDAGLVTPRAIKSALLSCTPGPSTPGTQGGGCAQLKASTPATPSGPQQLNGQLSLLRDFLSAVYASMPLIRSRGQATTYANLQKPVENLVGKNFKVYHLRQIKALYPEAFDWQHIRATVGGRKDQQQLLLLVHSPQKSAGSPDGSRRSAAELTREFGERVAAFLERNQKGQEVANVELPLADMPPPCPMPSVSSTTSTPSAADKARDTTPSRAPAAAAAEGAMLLPGTPQTALPGKVSSMSPASATPEASARRPMSRASPAANNNTCFSPVSRPPRFAHTTGPAARRTGNLFGTPTAAAGAAASSTPVAAFDRAVPPSKMRRLSFGGSVGTTAAGVQGSGASGAAVGRAAAAGGMGGGAPAAGGMDSGAPAAGGAVADGSAAAGAAAGGKAVEVPSVPVQPLGSGLKFELSAGLMAKLQQGSALAKSVDVQQERRAKAHANAAALVPRTFDVVRGIFGDKGPVVKPLDEVVRLLRQRCTFSSGLSHDQAREQITLLLRMAPHWIKQESGSGGYIGNMFAQLRIDRGVGASEVRRGLVRAAAAPVTAAELQQDVDASAQQRM